MTHNPSLLVDVPDCSPFTIALATLDGSHSHTNVCRQRGLLPIPLINGSFHYQMCFMNAHASDTFTSTQAIIDSSAGSFDRWPLDGYTNGRPGLLSIYSPLGLLKISIPLIQHDGLYFCNTDNLPLTPILVQRHPTKLAASPHILDP
jgi:hypothetical protein